MLSAMYTTYRQSSKKVACPLNELIGQGLCDILHQKYKGGKNYTYEKISEEAGSTSYIWYFTHVIV